MYRETGRAEGHRRYACIEDLVAKRSVECNVRKLGRESETPPLHD